MTKITIPPSTLTLDSWMVAWTPAGMNRPISIEVGPWPDKSFWSDRHAQTDGCCYTSWHRLPLSDKVAQMMLCQLRCIDDGVDSEAAHAEFMRIREYRDYTIASQGRPFYPVSMPTGERRLIG